MAREVIRGLTPICPDKNLVRAVAENDSSCLPSSLYSQPCRRIAANLRVSTAVYTSHPTALFRRARTTVSQETPASRERIAISRKGYHHHPPQETGVGWPAVLPRAFAPRQSPTTAGAAGAAPAVDTLPMRDQRVRGVRKGY